MPTVEAANTVGNAASLVNATANAPLLLKVIAPVNAFNCVKVMACAPALKLEVPPTVKTPVCVNVLPETIVKF